jgi:LCP family protein required for cell wall assembly
LALEGTLAVIMAKPTPTRTSSASTAPRPLIAGVAVLSALVAIAAAGAIVYIRYVAGGLNQTSVQHLSEVIGDDPVNVIVLGSDTREGLTEEEQRAHGTTEDVGGRRSDTLILVHLDPRREKAVLVHFPRDLRVEIPGRGMDRINIAYNVGGPSLVVETVKRFTGLPVHHYVEVNFVGFREVVDSLGGVRMCVDRPLIDPVSLLNIKNAGCSTFNGKRALAFVRARNVEGDAIPDFSRIARQQQFIRALLNKLLRVGTLVNPGVARSVAENVTTDANLSATDLIELGNELRSLAATGPSGATGVDFRTVPSRPEEIGGTAFVVADETKSRLLFQRLRSGKALGSVGAFQVGTEASPATIKVVVMDAGGGERAERVHGALHRAGFTLLGLTDAPPSLRRSEVLFRKGKESLAEVVKGFVPSLDVRPAPRGLLRGAAVAVIVGDDFPSGP